MANKKGQNKFQKKSQEHPEKRAVPRLKREITVQYRIKESPRIEGIQVSIKPSVDITRTRNLSERGIFFTASCAISAQTVLDIRLQLPTQPELICLEGRVVACEEIKKNFIYGIRVEFIKLKDEQKKALRKFVQIFQKLKGR